MKKKVEDKLKEIILSSHSSVKEFAQSVGIPYSTLDSILKRGVEKANVVNIIKICAVLGLDVDALAEGEIKSKAAHGGSPLAPSDEIEHIKKYRLLDHYGKQAVDSILNIEFERMQSDKVVLMPDAGKIIQLPEPWQSSSAGTGQLVSDDIADMVAVQYNEYTGKADYIMRVCGDSMEPEIHDGDRLLIRQQPAVEIGEVGIFLHEGERYVKRYQGDYLESINPACADISINDTTECIGKVIGRLEPEWIK